MSVLHLSRNFGHQAAVSGIDHARGRAILLMDGDLQDPPEVIPSFVQLWRDGYDVVYAIRRRRKEGWLKRSGYFSFYRLLKAISDLEVPVDSGDFCLMDRKVVEAIKRLPERKRFVRGLRTYVGFRQIGLAYERGAREAGSPNIRSGRCWSSPSTGWSVSAAIPSAWSPTWACRRPASPRSRQSGCWPTPCISRPPRRLGEHPRGCALHGLGPAHLPGDYGRVCPPDLPGVEAAPAYIVGRWRGRSRSAPSSGNDQAGPHLALREAEQVTYKSEEVVAPRFVHRRETEASLISPRDAGVPTSEGLDRLEARLVRRPARG